MVFKKSFKLNTKDHFKERSNNNVKYDMKPDGGWGWIVTCAMCLCLCLSTALRSSIGILYTYMIDEFGFDLTVLSIIGSINGAVSYTGAFFTVPLIERFGIRRVLCVGGLIQFTGCLMSAFASSFVLLLISLSIISGLGNALTYVTGVVAIDAYFDKKKSIAVSIATTGISLSRIIFPSTVEFLLSKYGFSDAMMIFSAILLNFVVCGAVVFPQRLVSQEVVSSKTEKLEKDMAFCKNTGFILYVLASFLYSLGILLPVGFIPETASARGISVASVSLTFVGSGIMDILGRISFGIISHRYSFYVCKIWSACLAGFGLSMLIVPFSNQLYQFLLFNLLNGLLNGGVNLGYALAIKNITEPKYYGRGISMSLVMQGLGILAGNPLAAYLQEIIGNENVPYYFGTIIFIMTALVLLPFSGSRQHDVSTIEIKVSEHHLGENDSKH
ncbi:monocarboxylate transporter 13-like [Mytilus californianus]|uniref:monocarboxylate transporter 13-like n=1 Tax=Mytilus californianus TaxID=6549 RepID=UPI0022457FE9|nr:monocarboxylate transporter 13-like [Mytilus californianus]